MKGERREDPPPLAAVLEPFGPLEAIDTEGSLLDVVDHLLDKGCVLTGELVLGLAGVDLVHVELSLLLSAADRLLPEDAGDAGTTPPAPGGERP